MNNIFQLGWNHQLEEFHGWYGPFSKNIGGVNEGEESTQSPTECCPGAADRGGEVVGGPQQRWMFFWFKLTTRYVFMFLFFISDVLYFFGDEATQKLMSVVVWWWWVYCFFSYEVPIASMYGIFTYIYLLDPIKINHSCFLIRYTIVSWMGPGFSLFAMCFFDHFSRLR